MDDYATKSDLRAMASKHDLTNLREQIKGDMESQHAQLNEDFKQLRTCSSCSWR